MTYKGGTSRDGTLAALQAAQLVREQQLKGEEKVLAKRYVEKVSGRQEWPEADTLEVLAALGITE